MTDINLIPTLFAIAGRAIEVAEAEKTRRFKADDLQRHITIIVSATASTTSSAIPIIGI